MRFLFRSDGVSEARSSGMEANAVGPKRILESTDEAKSPHRILVRSLLKSRNKLPEKYRGLRAECKKVAEPSRRGGAVTEYLARARVGTRSTCPRGSSRAGQPRVPTATTPGAIGATRSGIGRVARDWPPWKGRKKRGSEPTG